MVRLLLWCTFLGLFACFKGIWTFGGQTCLFGGFRVVLDMFDMIRLVGLVVLNTLQVVRLVSLMVLGWFSDGQAFGHT